MQFFGKIGLKSSPLVIISLIESYCVSVLLYSAESFWWSKSMLNCYESCYSLAFMKIFKTFDKKIVEQCQYYMGQLPIELKIASKQISFFNSLRTSPNMICRYLSGITDKRFELCNKYNIANVDGYSNKMYLKKHLWSFFANSVHSDV